MSTEEQQQAPSVDPQEGKQGGGETEDVDMADATPVGYYSGTAIDADLILS